MVYNFQQYLDLMKNAYLSGKITTHNTPMEERIIRLRKDIERGNVKKVNIAFGGGRKPMNMNALSGLCLHKKTLPESKFGGEVNGYEFYQLVKNYRTPLSVICLRNYNLGSDNTIEMIECIISGIKKMINNFGDIRGHFQIVKHKEFLGNYEFYKPPHRRNIDISLRHYLNMHHDVKSTNLVTACRALNKPKKNVRQILCRDDWMRVLRFMVDYGWSENDEWDGHRDIFDMTLTDIHGRCPLTYLIQKDAPDEFISHCVLKRLPKDFLRNKRHGYERETLLHVAIQCDNQEKMKLLLRLDREIYPDSSVQDRLCNLGNVTPIDNLSCRKDLQKMKILLNDKCLVPYCPDLELKYFVPYCDDCVFMLNMKTAAGSYDSMPRNEEEEYKEEDDNKDEENNDEDELSLMYIARKAIRQHLRNNPNYTNMYIVTQQLGLPDIIQQYLVYNCRLERMNI